MRETAQRLTKCPLPVWKYLADNHPYDSTLPHGMRCNECKDVIGDHTHITRGESPAGQTQRGNISEGTNVKQVPAPKFIDEP